MLPIWTGKVMVKNKWENEYKKEDGTVTTYYNVKAVDLLNYDNQTFSCTKELYDKIEVENEYFFCGNIGSNDKGKWWSIKDIADSASKK